MNTYLLAVLGMLTFSFSLLLVVLAVLAIRFMVGRDPMVKKAVEDAAIARELAEGIDGRVKEIDEKVNQSMVTVSELSRNF